MEQRCFTSLVFSANGGMGRERKKFYSVLAEMITLKRNQEYCITMSWLWRKTSFSLMRSILLFIRGSRGKIKKKWTLQMTSKKVNYYRKYTNSKTLNWRNSKKYLLYIFVRNYGLLIYSIYYIFLRQINYVKKRDMEYSICHPNAGKCGPEKLRIRIHFTQCCYFIYLFIDIILSRYSEK